MNKKLVQHKGRWIKQTEQAANKRTYSAELLTLNYPERMFRHQLPLRRAELLKTFHEVQISEERERENREQDKGSAVSTNMNERTSLFRRKFSPDPPDAFAVPGGTRLFAVFTLGGKKRICLLSMVFKFPMFFMTIGFVEVDGVETDGTSILIGALR